MPGTSSAPLATGPEPSPSAVLDMAWIELETGNSEQSERLLRMLQFDDATYPVMFSPTLITLCLRRNGVQARRLYDKLAARADRGSRISDLQLRLTNNPADRNAAEELERLNRKPLPMLWGDIFGAGNQSAGSPRPPPAPTGAELYTLHCEVCHGATGNAHGPSARHLFPRPRDLRSGKLRLVSTRNGRRTLEDLEQLLLRGTTGSSMPSFKDLPESERGLLAQEVLRLRREGVRDKVLRAQRQEGEDVDEADVRRAVEACTTPADRVRVPQDWPDSKEAVVRGKQSFAALGCIKCHGEDGRGSASEALFDDQGEPTRARDLVHEPLKGGREPDSVCRRIVAGMPGTPHPAVWNLTDEPTADLVQYVRSLAGEPQYALTNFERRVRAGGVEYFALPPADASR